MALTTDQIEIVDFPEGSCAPERVRTILERLSERYVPPLSEQVDVGAYADKLARLAHVSFGMALDSDIGILATYLDGNSGDFAFISTVGVAAAYEGNGIASKLLDHVKELARQRGRGAIRLEVTAGNDRAINFYGRHGFELVSLGPDGNAGRTRYMECRLHEAKGEIVPTVAEQFANGGEPVEPLVSVCMITYNHARFLDQALESVLAQQTRFAIEIIIHDDCSTDGTTDIVRSYELRYPGLIRPIYQNENRYSKGERIFPKTFTLARGKYIALLEGDDAWTDPTKLSMQVAFLDTNPRCVMCYGNVAVVDESGRILQQHRIPSEQCRSLTPEELIRGASHTPSSTVMFRNLPFLRHLSRQYNKVLNGDRFLVAMLAQHGAAGFLPFTPSIYRQHAGGIYSQLSASQKLAAHLNSCMHILACIDGQHRPVVCESIARIYTMQISYLRIHDRPSRFLRSVLGFAWFSVTHRRWRQIFRDVKICIYHLRRRKWSGHRTMA